ncbi:purine and uridine phosphorylase [Cenococcum geophilum]
MTLMPGGSGSLSMEIGLESHLPEEYTVGWICALSTELKAAQVMLDKRHPPLESVNRSDGNNYVLGRIGKHNVVMACLPEYGTVAAAKAATMMDFAFPSLRFGLTVGIGGGIPSEDKDIRLGDIVVSDPTGQGGGVIQYDLGRMEYDGFKRLGSLNKPPMLLRTAMKRLEGTYHLGKEISNLVTQAFTPFPEWADEFKYPGAKSDRLFKAEYKHINNNPNCYGCAKSKANIVGRSKRKYPTHPRVHYGNIASGNSVMKDALVRDHLANRDNVICFEMEAAGLMDNFPCFIIRGVSDYADSHKNWQRQPYAAAIAAAYAKRLLLEIPPQAIERLGPIRSLLLQVPCHGTR